MDWYRPVDLLIYYGWLNSFNSAVNGWNNEKVAQDFAKYGMLVFGDGLQNPSHGDYANTVVIIPRIKSLNPSIKIYGYVPCTESYSSFCSKVDQWDGLHVDGIFIDVAGYDYGTVETNSREAFNAKVNYIHGKTYSNIAFVNAWNIDHIIGTINDPSYPNSTWNPSLLESVLTSNDWYLLESFPINTLAFSGGYEDKTEWTNRGVKAINCRGNYGINLAAVAVIADANGSATELFNFGFISSLMFALDGFGSSDENFGSSSAKTTYRMRPDVNGCGLIYQVVPSVKNDINDNDIYVRYADYAKYLLDFSTSAQLSSIIKTYLAPTGGGGAYLNLGIHGDAGVSITWSNMPAVVAFLFGSHRHIQKVDLSSYSQCRLVVNKQGTVGYAGSKLILRYRNAFSVTATDYLDIGISEVSVALNVQNTVLVSNWIDLATGSKSDVFVAVIGSGGNGAVDPVFGNISVQFR